MPAIEPQSVGDLQLAQLATQERGCGMMGCALEAFFTIYMRIYVKEEEGEKSAAIAVPIR